MGMIVDINYIIYSHKSSEITTWKEFFDSPSSPVKWDDSVPYASKLTELLNFKVEGISNLDRLKEFVFDQEIEAAGVVPFAEAAGIPFELVIMIPMDKAKVSMASILGFDIQSDFKDFGLFLTDFQKKIQSDKQYRPSYAVKGKYGTLSANISVFLITKVSNESENPQPTILDITKSIQTVTTSVTSTGGNFQIQISPVFSKDYTPIDIRNISFKDNVLRRVSENDLVFIRFETLQIEDNNREVLGVEDLPGKIYDMIGLVDVVRETRTPTDVIVNISGRDLVKVLIDDQCYFYPLLFTDTVTGTFTTENRAASMNRRLFSTGKIMNTFVFSWRSIELSIKFIFTQLSSLGVLPEGFDIFSAYGDRRSKLYDVTSEGEKETTELANGIWQIMKIHIDESVSNRYLADPSLSNPDGSILGQFQKICQEPFVEFFTDTYGDEFYLIARKPPVDRESVVALINQPGAIIDLEPIDVESVDLAFDTEVYTWFEIVPQGAFIGDAQKIALAHIPILYFPEYAQIWGARRMKVVSNYISYRSFFGQRGVENYSEVKSYIIKDLMHLVEVNAYKPFTRKGTISIANGDRRIKRGNWVRLKQTGELFYVTAVNQTASIYNERVERNCTLQVERGMVEKFIEGNDSYSQFDVYKANKLEEQEGTSKAGWGADKVKANLIRYSYFNLINLGYIQEVLESTLIRADGSTTRYKRLTDKSEAGVNTDVFNFFLNRRQFIT